MSFEKLMGLFASIFTGVAMLPQLFKIIKEKRVENISFLWLVILFTGLCLWAFYGFLIKDVIIIISNLFSAAINGFIGILAIRYKKRTV
jgi:MtN3 and saliva related transmembrane protein